MKQISKKLLVLALALGFAASLSACGQRVQPANPEGKIIPSSAY